MAGKNWTALPFSGAVWVNPPVPLKRGGIYPFVDMQSVDSNARSVYSTQNREFTGGGSRFKAGDTLMARITPCLENGKIARFAAASQDTLGHGSTEFIVIRGRPGISATDFAFYLTKWDEVHGYAVSQMTGTSGRQRVPTESLSHLEVQLPPLPEQRAIAHILGTLDDKIELNRRMNETLETMSRAIFKSWFVDFDPVRAKSDGKKPAGMSDEIAALFPDSFQDSELGKIPKRWRVARAGELFEVCIGKTPPRKEPQWFSTSPSDVPWMSIKDLGNVSVFISRVSEFLTPDAVAKFRVKRIPDNTVVLSFKLTVGRVAITDGEMLSNEAIAHFLPVSGVTLVPEYLYCYLRQFQFDSLGSTSSIATAVNSDSIRAIPILAPTDPIAVSFRSSIAPLFQRIRILQRENGILATIRDSLLPKLISGEIRLKNAEKFLEAAHG